MSQSPSASEYVSAAAPSPEVVQSAGADAAKLPISTDPSVHPVVAAVVGSVQATMAPSTNWAQVAAAALQSLQPVIAGIEGVSRASQRTQGVIALAEMGLETLAGLLGMFFPHPQA